LVELVLPSSYVPAVGSEGVEEMATIMLDKAYKLTFQKGEASIYGYLCHN
jgi:hypothetical protein